MTINSKVIESMKVFAENYAKSTNTRIPKQNGFKLAVSELNRTLQG